ncbi:DapH/DapD/GlmU-related protein [Novosphingobium panipatense]|uniref:DapH/DapD/GlmU-related protein n=1 Tax=Novosphingobium panipatense TaxID=428991 RepID=UPI00361F7430
MGARSEVAEGVIVGEGAVLSMGVFIGASTKIVDRATGEVHIGRVPLRRGRARRDARQAACRRHARPIALLRGDREDR